MARPQPVCSLSSEGGGRTLRAQPRRHVRRPRRRAGYSASPWALSPPGRATGPAATGMHPGSGTVEKACRSSGWARSSGALQSSG
eukprot:3854347-Alexandrium_andersonii.AAC.1